MLNTNLTPHKELDNLLHGTPLYTSLHDQHDYKLLKQSVFALPPPLSRYMYAHSVT